MVTTPRCGPSPTARRSAPPRRSSTPWRRGCSGTPDLHIYHFAAYEPAALKRLVTRHGTRALFLDELLRSQRFVDLRAVVREGLRIGIESYGLKPLEELFGYRRELALQDAARAQGPA